MREAVALGVGGTIGGGIFVLIGEAAGTAGPGALFSFVLAFVAALLIALPYAELSCRYPLAGGGYAMARAVLGRHWGFVMGWVFWGAYVFISGYVTIGFGGYLSALTGLPVAVGAVALVAASVVLNLGGVKISGGVQTAVIVLGVLALVSFAGLGAPTVEASNLTPFLPEGFAGVGLAVLITFLAFGGFDMVAAAGEEVSDPDRNLPRAILLTLVLVLGLYLLVAFVAVGLLPWQELGASEAPLTDAASVALGPAGGTLIAVAALLTIAATGNAVLVVTSRISFAMARDGLLPGLLSRVGERTGAPWVTVLLNGVLLSVIALFGSIQISAAVGGFLYAVHFVFPVASLVALRRRGGGEEPAFRTPLPRVVLPLAFVGCLSLLVASGTTGLSGGLGWLVIGLAAYGFTLLLRKRNSRVTGKRDGLQSNVSTEGDEQE